MQKREQKAGEVHTSPVRFQGLGRGPSSFKNTGNDRIKHRNRKIIWKFCPSDQEFKK